jgi:hypothetical protein
MTRGSLLAEQEGMNNIMELNLSGFSSVKPGKPAHLLFIHHSVGGQLMADRGSLKGESSILKTHPNGGGLRTLLTENNYVPHEAAFGSRTGSETDVCHWNRKFREHMDRILRTRHQDVVFGDDTRNRVVMFQSGLSNTWMKSDGEAPGNPDSQDRTLSNYKAAYQSLLKYFREQPGVLFIALTSSPLVRPESSQSVLKRFLGMQDRDPVDEAGRRSRTFSNWLKNVNTGWLSRYHLRNVVVFDYYDVLTSYGASNWLRYPSGDGTDSHPSAEGNTKAAQAFIGFINRAMNRMISPVSTLSPACPACRMAAP